MRHCADSYIEHCAKGEYLMVSIRPAVASGVRRLERSTVGFAKTSKGFVVHNMSGFANAKVGPQVMAIAKDCVHQLDLQMIRKAPQASRKDALEVSEAMNDGAENQRLIGLQVRAA